MRENIKILVVIGLLAFSTISPALAAWNYAHVNLTYGSFNNTVYMGDSLSETYTSQQLGDLCNGTANRRFWLLEWNSQSSTGKKSEAYYATSATYGPVNRTNAYNSQAGAAQNVTLAAICSNDGMTVAGVYLKGWHPYINASAPPVDDLVSPVNFTGYPLDGFSPLEVNLSITNYSVINSTGPNFWSYGDGQTDTVSAQSMTHIYQNPGIYSVTLNYMNNSGTAKSITKTEYILASIPTGMIVNLDVKDAISGALIQDSTVSIRNTTSGVWRNTTAPTGLVYFSTTDPGYLYPLSQNQSITLAANKTGYSDASTTFNIPYTNYRARLFLMPTTITNATGSGNVVANVVRNLDGLTISGISVVMDSGQMGITNSAGATTLYNVTAGTRYATVTDPDGAYQTTKYAFNLTAGETKLIVIQMVKTGETPVTTFGSPTPTVTGTYDPNNPNSPVYGNYTTSQINEQGGAGVLGMLMQLIQLWPLIVVGILFKFLRSAFT